MDEYIYPTEKAYDEQLHEMPNRFAAFLQGVKKRALEIGKLVVPLAKIALTVLDKK